MDDYGFAGAALAGLHVYGEAARQSGRTTRMIASLSGGEIVVCANEQEMRHIEALLRRRPDCPANITVSGMATPFEATRQTGGRRRVVFTEQFVQREFRRQIEDTAKVFETFGQHRWHPEMPADEVRPVAARREG